MDISFQGEDGRDFLHPGELVSMEVSNLDGLRSYSVEGPENLSMDFREQVNGGFTTDFISPKTEGSYVVEVRGTQSGKDLKGTVSFRVESFDLRVFPSRNMLVSNKDYPGNTDIRLELVDWKGDPIPDDVFLSVSRHSFTNGTYDETGEPVEEQSLRIDGQASLDFSFPPVEETTLFHFSASLMDSPFSGEEHPPSECGVVIHPFPLELTGQRIQIEGGGSYVNGPYLTREEVVVNIATTGLLDSVSITDIMDGSEVQFDLTENVVTYIPETVSIFQLQVDVVTGDTSARALMIIPVNDYPILVNTQEFPFVGEEITVDVQRDNGAFFGVRSLLFNSLDLPVSTIMELVKQGSTSSPYFEKGLLDGQGNTDLTFRPSTNMRVGSYLLITGIGSWDGEIEFHGLSFTRVGLIRPTIEAPKEGRKGDTILIRVSDPTSRSSLGIHGSIQCHGEVFPLVNGTSLVTFSGTGPRTCIVSWSGRDATSFRITLFNNSLSAIAPDYVLQDQNISFMFFNGSSSLYNGSNVSYSILHDDTPFEEGGIRLWYSPFYSFQFHGTGTWYFTFSMPDHASATACVRVIDAVVMVLPESLSPGSPFTLMITDGSGVPLERLMLQLEGERLHPTSGANFTLTLPPGTHTIEVLSLDNVIHSETIQVPAPEKEVAFQLKMVPLGWSVLMILLLDLVSGRDRKVRGIPTRSGGKVDG